MHTYSKVEPTPHGIDKVTPDKWKYIPGITLGYPYALNHNRPPASTTFHWASCTSG
jgi:hypothetical protein